MVWRELEAYMRRAIDGAGYREVKTPQIMDARQWEQSGHWGKYSESMFVIPDETPNTEGEGPVISGEADWMALKPMNCPAHILIFKQGIKRSEEHTSELQSLMRISYAVFCLKKKTKHSSEEIS